MLKYAAEHKVEDLVEEALSPKRKRKIVTIFDEISNTLCCVADTVRFDKMNICNCVVFNSRKTKLIKESLRKRKATLVYSI